MRHFLCIILAVSALTLWTGCKDREEPEIPAVPAPAPPIIPPEIEDDEPPKDPGEVGGRFETISQAELAAIASAQVWLKLVDKGLFDDSWDAAADNFKRAVPKESWQRALGAVRTPLGRAVERHLKSQQYDASPPGAAEGQYVVIEYDSSFENKDKAIETVTPTRDADGQWRVAGYFIK
jgi:hypothetical protein